MGTTELAWGRRERGASTDLGAGPQSQSWFPSSYMSEVPAWHGQPVPGWSTALGPQHAWEGPGWERVHRTRALGSDPHPQTPQEGSRLLERGCRRRGISGGIKTPAREPFCEERALVGVMPGPHPRSRVYAAMPPTQQHHGAACRDALAPSRSCRDLPLHPRHSLRRCRHYCGYYLLLFPDPGSWGGGGLAGHSTRGKGAQRKNLSPQPY